MHQKMAATLERAIGEIRAHAEGGARRRTTPTRPRWPMIVLRSPKGWTGPKEIDGHKVEGLLALAPGARSPTCATTRRTCKLLEDWMRSYRPEELFDAERHGSCPSCKALAPQGHAAHERQPARQRRRCCARSSSCPTSATTPSTVAARGTTLHENTKPLGEFLRDVMQQQPDQLPRLRPGRDRVEPPAGDLRGEQEDLDGRHAARGRRRRRARARRPRHGDAVGAHAARLARGLSAHRPPRLLPHLRGLRARHRLDVQPARQVAGHQQEPRAVARAGRVGEHPAVVDGLAAGSQRLLASGSRLHRSRDQQERRRSRASTCRRTPTRCCRSPTTACAAPTTSTSSSPTSRSTCSSRRSTRRSSTAPRASASGRGPAPTPARSRTSCWRRCGDVATHGGAGGGGDPARAGAGSEAALRQRRRSVQAAAGVRASARLDRARVRQPVHDGQADHLQLPRLSRG